MNTLFELIFAPPSIGDRTLLIHLVAKTLIAMAILVVLWSTRTQAAVVYEAF
ncbi:MAG: hypothetical protein J4N64_04880 [Chloroflexi bacterium]|nr:hypothetical protein [Chloroflexota bacterium]MCI0841085.1 hypothetical protein [Chloroflexota bacterium]